jgi:putative inorganic carbon (HCO3(-)) transporter
LQTRQAFQLVVGCLLASAAVESVYSVYQWVVGVEPLANWEDPETLDPLTRVYGSLMNPNLLAGYLLPVFPLAVTAAAVWKGPSRYVGLATALAAPLAIWFTYSRGALIGMVASVAVFGLMATWLAWPFIKQQKSIMYGLAATAIAGCGGFVVMIAMSPRLQERIASIFTLRGHSSNSFRMNVWTGVLNMVQDNWVLGIGIGNTAFRKMYSLYMVSGFEALGAYNVFLEVLAEMGVIGLAVWLWLLLAFTGRNLDTFWRGQGAQRWWAAAIVAGFAGTFTMGMFDTVFYRPAVQLQFWLLLALTIAIAPRSTGNALE